MKVDVRLTPEEKSAVPDWEEQVAVFQRQCDERTKHARFRLCLHEGGHAVQYRNQFRWDVEFQGPSVGYESGELKFVAGSVTPIPTNNYDPFHWQHALVSASGFLLVEHFTAVPDEQIVIKNDLATLRSKLGDKADLNEAVWYAKMMLEIQLSEPDFIQELKQACRDYENGVYGTDEATEWGWREYRPEFPGQRHRVAVTTTGYFGTLIVDGETLKLVTEGAVFRPEDEIRGMRPEVGIAELQKVETDRAVNCWNEAARQTGPMLVGSAHS